MKKNIFKITLITILILLIFFIIYKHISNPTWDNVNISIKKDTLTSTSATIIIKNKNILKYTYNFNNCYEDDYYIDKKIDSKWVQLLILPTYNLNHIIPGEFIAPATFPYKYETTINWENKYGKLDKNATYRIRFEPEYYNSIINICNNGFITVEFVIK